MRISTNRQMQSLQDQVQRANERMAQLQMQVASGKRIQAPSDDPLGTGRVMIWRTAVSNNDQYRTNIQAGQSLLKTAEETLGAVQGLLVNARSLLVQGANGTNDQASRDTIAAQIDNLAAQVANLANGATVGSKHIFSGQKTDTRPFTVQGATLAYNGDDHPLIIEVSIDQTMQVSLPGEPLITDIYDMLQQARAHLMGGDVVSVSNTDIAALEVHTQALACARAGIGVKLQELTALDSQNVRRSDTLKQLISDTEDVDLAQAITDLRGAEVAYQASLTVTSSAFGLSLMDFISGG